MSILECAEGLRYQTSDETRAYSITTTNLVSSPTSPTAVVYDETLNGTDVTSTVMPSGTHTVSGDVITLKPLTALTKKHTYRIEVKWTVGSNIFERFFRVEAAK